MIPDNEMDAVEHFISKIWFSPEIDQSEVSAKVDDVLVHDYLTVVLERVHHELRERHEKRYGYPQAKESREGVWEKLVIDV